MKMDMVILSRGELMELMSSMYNIGVTECFHIKPKTAEEMMEIINSDQGKMLRSEKIHTKIQAMVNR